MSKLNHFQRNSRKNKNSSGKAIDGIYILSIIIPIFALLIVFQSFRWQIIYADKFKNLSKSQYGATQKQTAPRGSIIASDGTILAIDQPVWNVFATLSTNERERELFFSKKEKKNK